MVSLKAKFFNSFKNIKSDAVPQRPRRKNINLESETKENTNKDDTSSVKEEILIEEITGSSSSEDEKPSKKNEKQKKKFFSSKKKKENPEDEPSSPINTQASGNVINIVNCKDVHWGNLVTYNMGQNIPQNKSESTNTNIKKTAPIKNLMAATIEPEHEYLDYISKNLGKTWHSFFRSLGYSQGRIETVEIDEARNGVSEARYKLLLDWKRNDENGTLGHLATLLWDEDYRDIVKVLADIYKNSQS